MAQLHRLFGPGGKFDPVGAWAEKKLGLVPKKPAGPIQSLSRSEISSINASVGGAPVSAPRRRRTILNSGGSAPSGL